MTRLPGFRLLLPILALAACGTAHAQVRRCTTGDGNTVYTDRRCQDVGAVERLPQASAGVARLHRSSCSRNLQDLVYELTTAIDSRDVNRLAGVYNWTGMSNRNGYAVLGRLDAIANRPLVDVSAILPAPQLSVDAGGDMTVSGAVDARAYPGATVVRRSPVALRVEQTLANGSTPSRTVFGLRRHMGCWWVVL
jgi:hypothetical protein